MDLHRLLLLPCVLIAACSPAPERAPAPAATTSVPQVKLKARAIPAGMRTACSLTSKADAEAVAGEPMQEPEGDLTTCVIKPVKDTGPLFAYELNWTDGVASMKIAGGGESRRIDTLGDEAVLQGVMLQVRRGEVYFMFDTRAATDSQVIQLAKKVVANLDRP